MNPVASINLASPLSVRQRGATLLEILVTILIIAFGLMGLAALQAFSLKSSSTAYYRSQATMLSYDITERMRVNKTAALAGAYATTTPTAGASIADDDVIEWRANVASVIPMRANTPGDISVIVGGLSGSVTITIQWDGDGDGAISATNPSDTVFVVQTQL